jgi:hypothetical protein
LTASLRDGKTRFMKKFQVVLLSLITTMFLSGCMDMPYSPLGVLKSTYEDLKKDQFSDFRDHFVGECYTYASSSRGFTILQNAVKKFNSLSEIRVAEPKCDVVLGVKLPGYDIGPGAVVRQRECKVNLYSNETNQLVFQVRMSCFVRTASSHAVTTEVCDISRVRHWRDTPHRGYAPTVLCESKTEELFEQNHKHGKI